MKPFRFAALICAFWNAPVYAQGTQRPTSESRPEEPVFVFQDNFWVNLNHFLRAESRRSKRGLPSGLPISELAKEERGPWESALAAYTGLAARDLVFDQSMIAIDNVLAKCTDTLPVHSGLSPEILHALNEAAPVYQAHRWERDRRDNDRWISANRSRALQHAGAVKRAIAAAFQVVPPKGPILVDLARDVGPNLAYTTEGPPGTAGHTILSPQQNTDPDVALDTLFHEISHTMDDQIIRLVDQEASRQGVKAPTDLWHALTLYTTSVITEREISLDPGAHRAEADRIAMFERNGWREILAAIEKYWQPHLDGKATLERALQNVVRSLAR